MVVTSTMAFFSSGRLFLVLALWIDLTLQFENVNANTNNSCSETMCRASFDNLRKSTKSKNNWYDACWAVNISDPNNCADDYIAKHIDTIDAAALYDADDENLKYFTCCPPDYEGEIERQCDSKACSAYGSPFYNDKCIALRDETGFIEFHEKIEPISCNSDIFKHPNLVTNGSGYIVYNCCKADDSSIVDYEAEDPTCVFSACSNRFFRCVMQNQFGLLPEAYNCNDDRYSYTTLLETNSHMIYSCCEMDDGSLSFLSPGGYYRDTVFYFSLISQLVTSVLAVFISSLLMISILISPEIRSESYNIYIVFLATPDWIRNIYFIISNSMVLHDYNLTDSDQLVNPFIIVVTGLVCTAVNTFINSFTAHKLLNLVLNSNKRMKIRPPTKKQVLLECIGVYLVTIALGAIFYYAVLNEITQGTLNPETFVIFIWVWFAIAIIIPSGYLTYAAYQIWRTGMLSLTGRTRSLTIYFFRIILVNIVFLIPYGVLLIIYITLPHRGVWKLQILGVMEWLITLQGIVSAIFSFAKPGIRKSINNIWHSVFNSIFPNTRSPNVEVVSNVDGHNSIDSGQSSTSIAGNNQVTGKECTNTKTLNTSEENIKDEGMEAGE